MKEILAVIPARGGSQAVPGKNIRPLSGKPLLAYAIEEAHMSRHVTRTILSTDDEAIATVGRDYGVEIPFMRPPELAKNDTPSLSPHVHLLDWLRDNEDYDPDYTILLQPPSPFRTAQHIDDAIETFLSTPEAKSLVSITNADYHPHWMKVIDGSWLVPFMPDAPSASARQQLPDVYRPNGAIYIQSPETLRGPGAYYATPTLPFFMAREDSLNIDDEYDFHLAELIMADRLLDNKRVRRRPSDAW